MRKFLRMEDDMFPQTVYNRLPAILKEVVEPYDGRDRDIVLLSSLTVLSNIFPKIHAYYANDIVYPQMYTMIVAPAASGKSVMMKARRLIEPIHKYVRIKGTDIDWGKFESDEEASKVVNKNEENEKDEGDKKKKEYVQPVKTIVAADSSNAEFIASMKANPNGVIMIESEMDTMGNILKKEWGNYSDVLRKAFHHETISVSRKIDKVDIEIDIPKLALLLSGTPEQVKGITQSKENGLLSRFLVYSFEEISEFKNVFSKNQSSINKLFDTQGQEVLKIYKTLDVLPEEIIFNFSEKQQIKFLKFYRTNQEKIQNEEPLSFISNLRRLALIQFRFCMVLTVCRLKDTLKYKKELICSNEDFMISLNLIKTLIKHSLSSFKSYDNLGLASSENELLQELACREVFTRADFIKVGESMGMKVRTLDSRIKHWTSKNILQHIGSGKYAVNPKKVPQFL